jgi:hypothetical protein
VRSIAPGHLTPVLWPIKLPSHLSNNARKMHAIKHAILFLLFISFASAGGFAGAPVVDLGYVKYAGGHNATTGINYYRGIRFAETPREAFVGVNRSQSSKTPVISARQSMRHKRDRDVIKALHFGRVLRAPHRWASQFNLKTASSSTFSFQLTPSPRTFRSWSRFTGADIRKDPLRRWLPVMHW